MPLEKVDTNPEMGLVEFEAKLRLERDGPNALTAAIMVSVSPVHLPSGPQELHVFEDCGCEYLMRQYGLQQVDVVLET